MEVPKSIKSFFVALLVAGVSQATAQRMVESRLLDSDTGKPIPFASVGVVGTTKGTSTNLQGEFGLLLEEGEQLKITCIGYESKELLRKDVGPEIRLKPITTQLPEIVVYNKTVNAGKVARKALAATGSNYSRESFFQTYFYRHYCNDGGNYGRLIEAFVDVWRHNGYRNTRTVAGQREALRVSHLRRSLDRTAVSQGHEPIAIGGTLLADIVAYQSSEESAQLDFYSGLSNIRMDVEDYRFTFNGITSYDGAEVYEIRFRYRNDSSTNGGPKLPGATGTLFITTDTYAIVRAEETRFKGFDTVRTSAYYRKHGGTYYPYHLVRDGGTYASGKRVHWFHIDMTSTEISEDPSRQFSGSLPDKEGLLQIPYDSSYWSRHTLLKATPLESSIISDLGGGKSLNQQFRIYREYEQNTRNGGEGGEEKIKWLLDFYRGQRPVLLCYWRSGDRFQAMLELEQFKQLSRKYREQVTFVMVSLDEDEHKWQDTVKAHNLAMDGLLQYRVGPAKGLRGQMPSYQFVNAEGSAKDLSRSDSQATISALERMINEVERK